MKVLMFGWEFPPKIYGGLAVASYGITKGLSLQGDMETTFCLPKPCGDEEKFLNIIGMNQVPIVWRDVDYDYLESRIMLSVIISILISHICTSMIWGVWSLPAAIRETFMMRSITFLLLPVWLRASKNLILSMRTTG